MTTHSTTVIPNPFTTIQTATLKAYLVGEVEKARRRLIPPATLSNREFDNVVEDIASIRNLLKDVDELAPPKEGSTPEMIQEIKPSEKEKMREHSGVADPGKTDSQQATR